MFVFSPDDISVIRGNQNAAVRDNVLFELGLFVGRLGKDRCFILAPEGSSELRIPTDLIGLTPGTFETNRSDGNYQAATGPACHQIQERIERLGTIAAGEDSVSVNPPRAEKKLDRISDTSIANVTNQTAESTSQQLALETHWIDAFFEKRYDAALELIDKKITESSDPRDQGDLEAWRGRILYYIDAQSGITELEKLITKNPDQTEAYIMLALIHRERYLPDLSLSVIDKGLKQATDKYSMLVQKSRHYKDVGNDDKTVEFLRQAISEYPTRVAAYSELADYFTTQQNYEDARLTLEQALRAIPENQTLLASLAQLVLNHFSSNEALFLYRRLVSSDPDNPRYRTLLGNVYLNLELNDLAMQEYKRANDLSAGKQAWIAGNIGNLFKNRGLYAEGIGFLKRALEIAPNDDYAHDRLATALKLQQEEVKKASKLLDEGRQAILTGKYRETEASTTKSRQKGKRTLLS
jgi:tetratricopeptide (TPR) repeat protein